MLLADQLAAMSAADFDRALEGFNPVFALKRPVYFGEPVDMFKLFQQVRQRGGVRRIGHLRQWPAVAQALGFKKDSGPQKKPAKLKRIYNTYVGRYLDDAEGDTTVITPSAGKAGKRNNNTSSSSNNGSSRARRSPSEASIPRVSPATNFQ